MQDDTKKNRPLARNFVKPRLVTTEEELLNAPSGQAAMKSQRTSPILQHLQLAFVTFHRTWKWTLPLGLLCSAAVGAAMWYLMVPVYTATATMRIMENRPYIAFQPTDRSNAFVNTQLQLFRTRAILGPALEQIFDEVPDAREAKDPYLWLEENLEARVISGSELVQVSFKNSVPSDAQAVLVSIIESYKKYHSNYDKRMNQSVIGFLTDEKDRREKSLKRLRDDVREKSRNVASGELANLPGGTLSPLDEIQELLVQTEVDIELSQAMLAAAKMQLTGHQPEISDHDLDRIVDAQPVVSQMQMQLAEISATLANLQKAFVNPQGNPMFQRTVSRQKEIEANLQTYRSDFREEAKSLLLAEMQANVERQVQELEQEIQSKTAMKSYLEGRLAQEHSVQTSTSTEFVDLDFARTELAQEEEVFNRIASRIVSLQTEQFAPTRVEPIDEPNLPRKPDNAPTAKIAIVCLGAFFLPLLAITLTEHLMQRVTDASGMRDRSISVIGEIAMLPRYLPKNISDGADDSWRPATLFEESVDQLSSNLRHSRHLQEVQVLAIVSAISGEGKTHVATQLAVSLAKLSKEPVILIESDFRAPDIGDLLGIESTTGLLDVFSGDVSMQDAIVRNVNPHLDVLTAGRRRRNLHAVLHDGEISAMFDELRAKYRYVVIDTPPILGAGESLLFTSHCDATLICARRGYSRMSQVCEVYDRLSRTQSPPLGVVLNGVPTRHYVYSYGSYINGTT